MQSSEKTIEWRGQIDKEEILKARAYRAAIRPSSKRQRHTSLGCLWRTAGRELVSTAGNYRVVWWQAEWGTQTLQSCFSQMKWKWELTGSVGVFPLTLWMILQWECMQGLHVTHHTVHYSQNSTAWWQTWSCYMYWWTDKSIQREKKEETEKEQRCQSSMLFHFSHPCTASSCDSVARFLFVRLGLQEWAA